MRRPALLIALLLVSAAPAAAAAAPAPAVKLLACTESLFAPVRSATWEGRVRAAADTERMQMRFTLQVRDEASAPGWRRVAAAGFDTWLSSDPGVRRYSYARTVQNLPAPATYRVTVRFRRQDAEGRVTSRARVVSAPCRQPDLRPDLVPVRVEVLPGAQDGARRYAVTVRNGGRTAAGPFAVELVAGATALAPQTMFALLPGERRVLSFPGPPCAPGELLTVTADPQDAVQERDEADNVLAVPCAGATAWPAPARSGA